jgi:hypothetical protein
VSRAATFAAAIGAAALVASVASRGWTAGATTTVDFASNPIGAPPSDFELSQTGDGERGQWTVVQDATAAGGRAIEHRSTDPHDDRFPLAIYRPLSCENLEASVRFKIVSGTMQAAGLAIGVRNRDSYYAVSASALERRVDLLLFAKGQAERIASAEADVALNRWQTLRLTADDDHFTVALDGKELLVTFDRTRRKDGRVALWTQEDNVTRFDQLEIRPLPAPRID